MLEFLVGFSIGLFIGTNYNCKPYMDFVLHTIKNNMMHELHDINHEFKNDFKS